MSEEYLLVGTERLLAPVLFDSVEKFVLRLRVERRRPAAATVLPVGREQVPGGLIGGVLEQVPRDGQTGPLGGVRGRVARRRVLKSKVSGPA